MKACEWCQDEFEPSRSTQKFCKGKGCNQKASNARRKYVREAVPAAPLEDVALIQMAEERGFRIHRPEPTEKVHSLSPKRLKGKDTLKLGVVSCTHFGSKYQQLGAFRDFCSYAADAGADYLVHAGDMTDGPLEMHKGMVHEQFLHTYDAQREYAIDHLPDVDVPWLAISGNHDDSFLKNAGGEIVRSICEARDDMTYLGRSRGMVRLKNLTIEVIHPHMGGAYALSYRLQKHIEALAPEQKSNIVLMGNFHKHCHIDYRNVAGFILPAFQSQTSWMASKGLPSVVGGLILEVGIDDLGLAPAYKTEWVIERRPSVGDWPGANVA